ncbi:DUF4349 domain-containing protein [Terrabacter terrigena]|uniref:DUF4349 domain-containing protein n=1 Tax=Terrabacter terrigena TaxID=574718 RepID=A0ABW3MTK3_9MICO
MTASSNLPRLSSVPSARRRALAVVAAVVVVVALAFTLGSTALQRSASTVGPAAGFGSSSGSGTAESSRDGAAVGLGAPAVAPAPGSGTAKTPGDVATPGAGTLAGVVAAKIARTAWLGIKVGDLTGSAARARVIATGAGGQVTSENVVTSIDPTGSRRSADQRTESGAAVPDVGVDEARMVLSVPAKALDQVLTDLSKLGSVSYRSSQSEDVTDTYIDTKARIEPMRDGIDRVRALLARTTDLQQVITLESELTRRQADLDSLTQRLAQLDEMTTTSDVTLTLWTDATTPAATSDGGIAGGLRTAWDSLLGSVTVILTGLAALLPWLVLLVPLTLLALRIRRRRGAVAVQAPAAPEGKAPELVGAPARAGAEPGAAAGGSTPGAGRTDPDD